MRVSTDWSWSTRKPELRTGKTEQDIATRTQRSSGLEGHKASGVRKQETNTDVVITSPVKAMKMTRLYLHDSEAGRVSSVMLLPKLLLLAQQSEEKISEI